MKTCVLILGMHRSGTSAVTGALEKLGVSLPQDLWPAQDDNPKGFFEGRRVIEINELILKESGSSYDDTRFQKHLTNDLIEKYLDRTKRLIEEEFSYSKIFALKDPRMCVTFPLWERALKELEIEIKVILPYRNPFEVARSLKSRNDFSTDKSLLIWVKHVLYAEKYSRSYSRYFLSFNSLLTNAEEEITKIANFIGVKAESSSIGEVRSNFLEKELKHHNLNLNNVAEEIPFFIKKLIAFVERENFSEATVDEFDVIFNEASSLYKLFHTHDVQFQSDISRALHAQRDQASDRAQSLEQQLSEQQHANEQVLQGKEDLLRQLEAEKTQLEQTRADQAEQSQAKIKTLEGEKAELAGAREQLEREMGSLLGDLEAVKKAKQTQKSSYKDRIHTIEQQLCEQQHANEQMLQGKEDLLRQLEAEKTQLEQARADQVEQSQAEIKILEGEKAELAGAREQLEREMRSLLGDLETVKKTKQTQKASDEDRIHTLEQQLSEQQHANEQILQVKEDLLRQLEVEKSQMEYARVDREEQYEIKIKELEDEKVKLIQDRNKLAQEVKLLTESIDQVVKDLSRIKESKSWIYTKPIRNLHKVFFKKELEKQ
ncbi:sulfotransferase domain-containing protein [Vreelandella nanhaiensis]|nr:sulfotransferase domain-containing protein [Halomonas nanhaiensis]